MEKTRVRVSFDKIAAIETIRAASDKALTAMGIQALQDVSQYVPKDRGTLENSGLENSDQRAQNGKFTLRWDEPYAQYLWHGKIMHGSPKTRTLDDYYDPIEFTSDLAREEWAKYAYEIYGEEWRQVYQAALERGLE